jgi:TetR/AcrR family transcriptional regulator
VNVLPTRRERRRARTLNAILDAAERHFLERGYEEAKVDAIAADADVAVGSIYNYFGSKDGLYAAALDRAVELFELYLGGEADLDLSALERVLDTAGRLARFAREHPGQMRLLCLPHAAPAHPELAAALARAAKSLAAHERRTAALIEAASRQGAAQPVDARDTAAFLWAAWKGALTLGPRADRAAPGRDRELQALLEAGLRVVVGGLASDEARRRDATVRALLEGAAKKAPPAGSPSLRRAPVASELRERFPELALWTGDVETTRRASPAAIKRRLVSRKRAHAPAAIGLHDESTPWAYKVFVRRLGLDPDAVPSPVEALVLHGDASSESRGLPDDALAIAAAETGVPILAFDADQLGGDLWLRPARDGERVGDEAVAAGMPVVADDHRALAAPFGPRDGAADVTRATTRVALAALQVKGIPDVSVEHALWTTIEIVRDGA